jgi:hypothetical protein
LFSCEKEKYQLFPSLVKTGQAEQQPQHPQLLRGAPPPGLMLPSPGMLASPGMLSAALQGSPHHQHHNPPTPPRTPQAASPLTGMPPLLSMAAYMKPNGGGGGSSAAGLPPSLAGKSGGVSGGLQGRLFFAQACSLKEKKINFPHI